MTSNQALADWVREVAALTQPDRIHWCDGSQAEYDTLVSDMLRSGTLLELDPETRPRSYLHRSHPSDVARTEHLTFVCTPERDDSGPNNQWMAPAEAHSKMDALFAGAMRGRTQTACGQSASDRPMGMDEGPRRHGQMDDLLAAGRRELPRGRRHLPRSSLRPRRRFAHGHGRHGAG